MLFPIFPLFLFIAMAGHHQIWIMDLARNRVAAYAGDGGENIVDGTLAQSRFAQPSGLATDGKTLYVADSETSSIRTVPMTWTMGRRPRAKPIVASSARRNWPRSLMSARPIRGFATTPSGPAMRA